MTGHLPRVARSFHPDGSLAWGKTLAYGSLSGALAIGFDRASRVVVAGYGTEAGGKSSSWWIASFAADGVEAPVRFTTLAGPGMRNMPFALRVNELDEVQVLGTGRGRQFSRSRLERWRGW